MKRSKRFLAAQQKVADKKYSIADGLSLVKENATAKFDETVEVSFRLGVDPKHADQIVRGAIVLPSGTGKSVKVLVITSGENIKAAEDAGADFVGSDDLIQKIAGGWLEFDRMIASPDMMGKIGRIGRLLGPRGLMPNPKLGTVTTEISKAVKEQKSGKVEYRTEKSGLVQLAIGKSSFSYENLRANFDAVAIAVLKAKPVSSKGIYMRSVYISSSMGPSVCLDTQEVINLI